jgi:hypothetical protein
MIWYAISRTREGEAKLNEKLWAIELYGWKLMPDGTPYYETDDARDPGIIYVKQMPGVFVLPKDEIPAKMLVKRARASLEGG